MLRYRFAFIALPVSASASGRGRIQRRTTQVPANRSCNPR
jgi:hypothetical protein